MDSMSNTKDYDQVENTIGYNNNFSFSETLGTFINNYEFSQGYLDFINNRQTADSYSWVCLSAIGDKIGETLYENVVNYIDFVSNVDICKITSLRSMLKMFGFDYTVFDDIEQVPIELYNLMNIFSVNNKYLFDNKTFKSQYIDEMYNNFMSGDIHTDDTTLSTIFKPEYLSSIVSGDVSLDSRVIDDDKFFDYICNTYKRVISDFIYLEYNVPDNFRKDDEKYYVYKTLDISVATSLDTELDFRDIKVKYDIPLNFDYKSVVDDIDNEKDSLVNYSYPYTILIQSEIDRRSRMVLSSELQTAATPSTVIGNILDGRNQTRYSYYRKAKVRQYVNFVNNKYFIDHIHTLSAEIYDFDHNYMDITHLQSEQGIPVQNVITNGEIKTSMIDAVAVSLAIATTYVKKLREKLKNQTRKNYMKGTQNLLLYIVNEYLIDYSKHKLRMIENTEDEKVDQSVKDVLTKLADHDLQNLEVIEYYDTTEYYNQQTSTSSKAKNSNSINPDFWKNLDMSLDNGLAYKLDQIQNFYLNTMKMSDVLSSSEQMADFLDAVYSIGADDSYFDKDTDIFHTQLNKYKTYSSEIYPVYMHEVSAWNYISAMLKKDYYISTDVKSDYKHNDDYAISVQTLSILDYIFPKLSAEYLNDVSVYYNKYIPSVDIINSNVDSLIREYENVISGSTTDIYFISTDSQYCYKTDEATGYKSYRHDYYIDNPQYQDGALYITDKLANLRSFIYSELIDTKEMGSNITNHQLMDALSVIIDNFVEISSMYKDSIVPQMEEYGFHDINAADIDSELQYGYDFISQREQKRREYLLEILNQIRTQVSQLQADYTGLESTFAQIVATYDDGTGLYNLGDNKFVACSLIADGGNHGISDTRPKKFSCLHYCIDNKKFYYQVGGKGPSKESKSYSVSEYTIDPEYVYNKDHKLLKRISEVEYYLDLSTSYMATSTGLMVNYGFKNDGTYASLQQCKATYNELLARIVTISNRLSAVGGEYDYKTKQTEDLIDQINSLADYVTTLDESYIERDSILKGIIETRDRILALSSQYTPIRDEYWSVVRDTKQAIYLGDLNNSSQVITYKLLMDVKNYTTSKDTSNKISLISQYNDLNSKLTDIQIQFDELTTHAVQEIYRVTGSTGVIEVDLSTFRSDLIDDVDHRIDVQSQIIDDIKEEVCENMAFLSSQLSDSISDNVKFDSATKDRIDYLNFFQDSQYVDKKTMFYMYTGLSSSYYPYYNLTNVTHPSYQIHPFLWNFVERTSDYNISPLTKQFYNVTVSELEDINIHKNIDSMYGDYGNSINIWKTHKLDYSGYTTRYEYSDHYSDINTITSEVVGYDGSFYPPAVEMLRDNYQNSINSLSDCIRVATIRKNIIRSLSGDMLDYIETGYVERTDETTVRQYICDRSVNQTISSYILPYYDIDLGEYIDGYFLSRHDETGELLTVDREHLADYITSRLDETFYGRFYLHMALEINDKYRQFLVDQLIEYTPQILEVAKTTTNESDVYDMYRYGVDNSQNQYILFKKYNTETPTFKEKRNTRGDLWIRQSGNPFAFPAFSGKHPVVKMDDESRMHPLLRSLAGNVSPVSDMKYFYDFDLSKDNRFLYLISAIKTDNQFEYDLNDEFVSNYENPWIGVCPLGNTVDDTKQIDMYISNDRATSITSIIRSGYNIETNPELKTLPNRLLTNQYAFIGQFIRSANETVFVYAKKTYDHDKTVKFTGDIKMYRVKGGLTAEPDRTIIKNILDSGDELDLSDIVFAYDGNNTITFAYVVKMNDGQYRSKSSNSSVVLSSNTDGYIFEDNTHSEMNSHDIFSSNIKFTKWQIIANTQLKRVTNSSKVMNLNADMSYIPVYPGISATNVNGIQNDGTIRIELLGESKNIDSNIAQTNISVDPYFDFNRISSDQMFGRVYEDYDPSADHSFRYFKNPPINNNNSGKDYLKIYKDYMIWDVVEMKDVGYTDKEFNDLQFAFYRVDTLGKNPYMIDSVKTIKKDNWTPVSNYNKKDSEYAEIKLGGIRGTSIETFINATGTYDGKTSANMIDNNHIDNICDVYIKADDATKTIKVKFVFEDPAKADYTFMPEGKFQLIVFNTKGLRIFNYYHYLDAYGAVNVKYEKVDIPDDIFSDGLAFIYDRNKFNELNIRNGLCAYYMNQHGDKQYTAEIDLSEFDALSDVYILKGSKRLQFKYGEQEIFDFSSGNYYFPSLNSKYPRTLGQAFDENNTMDDRVQTINNIFGENNLFVIDCLDANSILSDIGEVDIKVETDDTECYRVFESETVFEDGESFADSFGEYDGADSRSYTYIHCNDIDCGRYGKETQIDTVIRQNGLTQDAAEKFESDLNLQCYPRVSESTSSANLSEKIRFNLDRSCADLSKFLRMYVNYKKESDGIHLYFNYFNYIDTPYMKIVDNKYYPDIIDYTYLHLKPDESGVLKFITQLKYYIEGEIAGIKNIELASLQIFNVSDDKPKFLIKTSNVISYDGASSEQVSPIVTVGIENMKIDTSSVLSGQYIHPYTRFMIESNKNLSAGYRFGIDYPDDIMDLDEQDYYPGFTATQSDSGYITVTVTDPSVTIGRLNFTTRMTAGDLKEYKADYPINTINDGQIIGANGKYASVTYTDGIINIV